MFLWTLPLRLVAIPIVFYYGVDELHPSPIFYQSHNFEGYRSISSRNENASQAFNIWQKAVINFQNDSGRFGERKMPLSDRLLRLPSMEPKSGIKFVNLTYDP